MKHLGFASPERLKTYLALEPGAVTLLGLVNDFTHAVEVVIDRELSLSEAVRCHPLVNTATLVIPWEDILKYLSFTGHVPRLVDIPTR